MMTKYEIPVGTSLTDLILHSSIQTTLKTMEQNKVNLFVLLQGNDDDIRAHVTS